MFINKGPPSFEHARCSQLSGPVLPSDSTWADAGKDLSHHTWGLRATAMPQLHYASAQMRQNVEILEYVRCEISDPFI